MNGIIYQTFDKKKINNPVATINSLILSPEQTRQAYQDSMACRCGNCICCVIRNKIIEKNMYFSFVE
ncbi:MAG: hypothetical protein AABY32_01360 [Nanoarchaeota archaeon]